MAEAAGLVSGAFGVAGLFSVCVQVFDAIQLGRTQDHKLRILMTKLDNKKARFIIWGKALGRDSDSGYDERIDESPRKERIRQSCELIYDLFTEIQTLRTRHGLEVDREANTGTGLRINGGEASAWRMTFRRRRSRLSSSKIRSQQNSHLARWIVKDHKDFMLLVSDLRELIDNLESQTAFHDVQERQRLITSYEIESIPDNGSVQIVEESTADEQGLVSEAASIRLSSLGTSGETQSFYTADERPSYIAELPLQINDGESETDSESLASLRTTPQHIRMMSDSRSKPA